MLRRTRDRDRSHDQSNVSHNDGQPTVWQSAKWSVNHKTDVLENLSSVQADREIAGRQQLPEQSIFAAIVFYNRFLITFLLENKRRQDNTPATVKIS